MTMLSAQSHLYFMAFIAVLVLFFVVLVELWMLFSFVFVMFANLVAVPLYLTYRGDKCVLVVRGMSVKC